MAILTLKDKILLARAKGSAVDRIGLLEGAILSGDLLGPLIPAPPVSIPGGSNYCPNSDLNFSKMAAEVAGTLPSDPADDNFEAWRWYWVAVGDDVVLDDAHTLKAVGHSLYAAEEGTTLQDPIWDRTNGWAVAGSSNPTKLYDLVAVIRNKKIVGAGQKWFMRFLCSALDGDVIPADLELFAGFWHFTGGGAAQGWLEGDNYTINAHVEGEPGTTSIDYRVLTSTDSGISMLSAVVNVPNAPDVLDDNNFVQIDYDGGPGFIIYDIFRLRAGVYEWLFSVRNSVDLQYNDTGVAHRGQVEGWPVESQTKPRALAQTTNLSVATQNATEWGKNELTIQVSPFYDSTLTDEDGLMLRIGLNRSTTNNRQIAIDRIVLSTTNHEWEPDQMQTFPDGTEPIPTISPTYGSQGGSGGVGNPPAPGTGGPACITIDLPVRRLLGGREKSVPYSRTSVGDILKIRGSLFLVLQKRGGMASGYFRIRTTNGITYKCVRRHILYLDYECREEIEARSVRVGMKLSGEICGRNRLCTVKSIKYIPVPVEVGTYVLRDLSGTRADGRGIFAAGISKKRDRFLHCKNTKPVGPEL